MERLYDYGIDLWSCPIEHLIERYDYLKELSNRDLNDYIELFLIGQHLENGKYMVTESCDDNHNIESMKQDIRRQVGMFFNQLVYQYVVEEIKIVELSYLRFLVQALSNFKFFDKISEAEFKLLANDLPVIFLLENKQITKKFSNILTDVILENPMNAEILIQTVHLNNQRKISIPDDLTPKKRDDMFSDYIQSSEANPNYIKDIFSAKFTPPVDEYTKLCAKRAYDEKIEEHFLANSNTSQEFGYIIGIKEMDTQEIKKISRKGSITEIMYNERILLEALDYPSILQNFIYIFDLVDHEFRFSGIELKEESSSLMRVFQEPSLGEYPDGVIFKNKQSILIGSLGVYKKFLEKNNIFLEDVIVWFFSEYLVQTFDVSGFGIVVPSKDSSYYEKNSLFHSQLHRVVKEYYLYSTYGEIDNELLNRIATPAYEDLISLSSNKYLYLTNKRIIDINNFLFSDQITFAYPQSSMTRTFERVLSKKIRKSKLADWEKAIYNDLSSEGIWADKNDTIQFLNNKKIALLKDFFDNTCINRYWIPEEWGELLEDGSLNNKSEVWNRLFSKEESAYLNYYLTDKFSNSRSLRNKYAHGSTEDLDEEEHEHNYIVLLFLFILVVIKINEEFDYKYRN
ncbi:hypothetical protein HCB69_08935 [Listeria booriae]|uniref:Apea-like HEPN domain-containing protein n=1 Tax=Listeria booriae TaxID=1552123 RepID=A0A842FIH8_9LIST|nr:hypothetical protein [Listeria booriae]MBC2284502.1 hypothetical protein [Listeria booriae]MBC2291896.1 hypothetical protein [Listeria booriae]